ncbi:MAG: GNAT family N-acetyltransferase [Treponema sp.]|nr:GNAT family N-acetyltransferase [Treponema sp.]
MRRNQYDFAFPSGNNKNGNFHAVCLKENAKLIGNIYLEKQDFDTWKIGFVFNAKFWYKGYATEAAKALA